MNKATLDDAFSAGLSLKYIPKGTPYELVNVTKIKMDSGEWVEGISYKCIMGMVYSRALTDLTKFELVKIPDDQK